MGEAAKEPGWEMASVDPSATEVVTEHGRVRLVPPRAMIPGTDQYDNAPMGPRVTKLMKAAREVRDRSVPRDQLGYFPQWHTDGHPTSWEFPAYLDNKDCAWLQTLKALYAEPISFPSSLAPEAGLLVHSLVRNYRPRVVVETGTFVGISAMWIAAALKENGDGGVLHTFDSFGPIRRGPWREVEMLEGRLEFVAGYLARAGLGEHVVLHPGNSAFEIRAAHEALRGADGKPGVQLAFLDGDHSPWGVSQDLWATEPVLATGGLVLFHDTFPEYCGWDGPRHVLDKANRLGVGAYEKVDLYLSPINYGLGLLRRVG